MEYILILGVLFLVLFAEFINGWTDAPNAIATVISTRTLSPRQAILMATIMAIIGAFIGTAVATTIATEFVKPEGINLSTISAAMLSIIFWGMVAWRFGLPTSKSHALVAALTGASYATAGASVLLWEGWIKVFIGLIFSTFLGAFCGWLLTHLIRLGFAHSNPTRSKNLFGRLQIFSSSFVALSHGSNDGQKFIGIFTLSLLLANLIPKFQVPVWVIFCCALTMGLGTSVGGLRIIKTMGYKMVHLETYQGFAAETAAASTIMIASVFGIPLSTTHTISTAIMGVGVAKHHKAVKWKVVRNIVYAWILTFPLCGLLAYFAAIVYSWIGILGLLGIMVIFLLILFSSELAILYKRFSLS